MLERVLIVDEDVRVRDFLYDLISGVGFDVLTVPSGAEALERLQKERPAFIIIEDPPGEFSGIFLAKKIRRFDKDIKIIMLGQDPHPQGLADQLEEADISAYLKKDFQNPEIIKNILSVLKHKIFPKQPQETPKGRVLIVDDEFESRETVGNFLRRRGFAIDTAASGEECLEKVKEKPYDVVLLDITMSGMDGLVTLKRLTDMDSSLKVVMVTAHGDKTLFAKAQNLGAIDYLVKPFDFKTLESSILSILSSKS